MGPKKRVTALANSPKYKLKSTPIKKAKRMVISRKGTPSGSKASSSTKASSAPPADCLHELRFYPCDTPWHPHPEPAKRKLCPPCWLAQSKVWGLTGPEIGTTAECDRIPWWVGFLFFSCPSFILRLVGILMVSLCFVIFVWTQYTNKILLYSKSCKKKGFGAEVCSGSVGEDGRDPWAAVEEDVMKQDAEVQHTMVWIR